MPNSNVSRTPTEPQPPTAWIAPGGALGQLLQAAEARAAQLRGDRATLERRAAAAASRPRLATALRRPDVAVIAEMKRASPSGGTISATLDPSSQAAAYAAGGAAAISVLTEPLRFSGSLSDLEIASTAVSIPLLRKDFILTEEQILEARIAGASAILLIARALPAARLLQLVAFAQSVGVEPLVEIRNAPELTTALAAGTEMIGINARDLESLEIDPSVVPRLAQLVPDSRICIAESGMRSRTDVEDVAAHGVDAVLIGSALSASDDPAGAVRSLAGVPRMHRVGGD